MGENTNNNTQNTADYLAQLLKDKKQLTAFPNVFMHVERLLDEEIVKIRGSLFQINGVKKEPLALPESQGVVAAHSEKVYVPVKEHPDFNFVGRILGPRGMTAKQLEQETGCKIMVRGRGSMRDKKKEEQNRGKQNWEHLSDELHVLITVEDTPNRSAVKLQRAVEEIKKLLIPAADGEDELKKRQLMELAIINGTYRDSSLKNCLQETTRLLAPPMTLATSLRSPSTPLGAPLILSPRMPMGSQLSNGMGPPPLIAPGEAGLLYAPYADYHQYATLSPALLAEYPGDHTGPASGWQLTYPVFRYDRPHAPTPLHGLRDKMHIQLPWYNEEYNQLTKRPPHNNHHHQQQQQHHHHHHHQHQLPYTLQAQQNRGNVVGGDT